MAIIDPDMTIFDPFGTGTGPTIPPDREPIGVELIDRELAIGMGRKHNALLDELGRLADANGGGLDGAAKALLHILEKRELITGRDADQLRGIFDAFSQARDPEDLQRRVQAIHDAMVADPGSSVAALLISGIAASGTARSNRPLPSDDISSFLLVSNYWNGYSEGYADAIGVMAGVAVGGGIPGGFAGGTVASYLAEHITVTWR